MACGSLQSIVGNGGNGDTTEYEDRIQIPKAKLFGRKVAGGRTQGEGKQDSQPVKGLAAGRNNGVDRQCLLQRIPYRKGQREKDRKCDGRRRQRNAELVCQVVGDQGTNDTDQNDGEPVNGRDVFSRLELKKDNDDE